MNAFDEAMHAALLDALDAVAGDASVRALVVTGTGRAFSSGQDLGERASAFNRGETPDLRASLEDNYNPLVLRLGELPIPVIGAVNGIAFGAGAALAIACDLVVAARSVRFQFGFVNVGLGPDSGASWFLPRLVGLARAFVDKSSEALTAIKRQLRANSLLDLAAALDAERDAQAALGQTDTYREAVLRFSRPK